LVFAVCACLLVAGVTPALEVERYFGEGVAVATRYEGEAKVLDGLADGGGARAVAAGDFDEDGVPDLAVVVETSSGSVLVLYRGNVDAVYPNTLAAKRRRTAGEARDSPFLSPARVRATPANPDYLSAGDFDADGHLDLMAVSIGDDTLYLHRGDGQGKFAPATLIRLPGELTALTSGEVNRRDGLVDVVTAVRTSTGPRLLIFEDPAGAFAALPENVDLGAEAIDLALGQLDGVSGIDLAIAARSELSILHGRDRQKSAEMTTPAVMSRLRLPFPIVAVAIGDFATEGPPLNELAVLSGEGGVRLVAFSGRWNGLMKQSNGEIGAGEWTPAGSPEWRLSREIGRLEVAPLAEGRVGLLRVRSTGGLTDDLVVVGTNDDRLQVMVAARGAKERTLSSRSSVAAPAPLPVGPGDPRRVFEANYGADDANSTVPIPPSLSAAAVNVESSPRDAVALRLNGDALSDLVVLVDDRPEPVVIDTKAGEIVVVDSTTDLVDGVTTSISDLNASPGTDGVISLREAITAANNTLGADTVHFNIPVDTDPGCDIGSGVCTIQPGGFGLPTITQPVTIDGTTQPSFSTTPVVEIGGSLASTDATGLAINAGSSTIRGLVINRFATNSDIVMWGAGGNVVEGNFLGVDASGTINRGTTNSVHVYAISDNTIGGTTAAARNVISGNTNPAVALNEGAWNNVVQGNFIGTDMTGTVALGNSGNDVVTLDSPDNTIGGTTAGAGNLIAGNLDSDFASVGLGFPASTGNLVQGNFVGTDITGAIDLGGASIGVYIAEGSNNTVGGTTPAAANLISGGDSAGVGIANGGGNFVQGNLIGTQVDGVTPLPNSSHGVLIYAGAGDNTVGGRTTGAGNTIAFNGVSGVDLRGDAGVGNTVVGNSVFGNAELGINFCSDFDAGNLICNDATAVIPNDPNDPDAGANNLQNFPDLIAVIDGSTVDGSLDSIANSDFTIDFYASSFCDPSGHGEGETYLGSDTVTTNADGDAAFKTVLAIAVPEGWYVAATATDSDGSTSEFSQCLEVPTELIFADAFESGDTAAWSTVVP
jgi:hypothetical protein